MAKLQYGVSGQPVKTLQRQINKALGASRVKENGEFDEATAEALAELQENLGIQPSGVADGKTMDAIKDALIPRCAVKYKGQVYYLTKEEHADLLAKIKAKAKPPVQRYVEMATEVKSLWDAHNKTRDDNWFWSGAVDVATGAKFPPKSQIDAAVGAANAMASAAGAGTLTVAGLDAGAAKIRQAYAAIDQYREETFGGGAQLVKNLEMIRDGCIVVLEISAAVATGGASWQVQVAAGAAMGGYKAMLGEIDKASSDHTQTWESAALNIFAGAAIDGGAALIMKGKGKGMEKFIDKLAEKAAKKVAGEACKKAGTAAIKAFAIKAIQGGSKAAVEEAIKGVCKAFTPGSKVTAEEILESVAKKFVEGAVFQNLEGELSKFGKKLAKHADPKMFKGLGKVDIDKAMAEGGKKVIEESYNRAIPWAVKQAHGDPKKISGLLTKKIGSDPVVTKWFKDYEKKKGKEKRPVGAH